MLLDTDGSKKKTSGYLSFFTKSDWEIVRNFVVHTLSLPNPVLNQFSCVFHA